MYTLHYYTHLCLSSDEAMTCWNRVRGRAVRQPPYKMGCFVTPCLETWAAAAAPQAFHRAQDSHRIHRQRLANGRSCRCLSTQNVCSAHDHLFAEKRLATQRQRGKTTICYEKTPLVNVSWYNWSASEITTSNSERFCFIPCACVPCGICLETPTR